VLVKPASGEPYSIPATREITIRDLLRHTSGLTYQWNDTLGPVYQAANVASGILPYDGTIEDSVKLLAALPLLFNPGDRWEYSLGVDVLGRAWWKSSPARHWMNSYVPKSSNRWE
jgi:CubicO group peptidase (beta-lactamase class C family)